MTEVNGRWISVVLHVCARAARHAELCQASSSAPRSRCGLPSASHPRQCPAPDASGSDAYNLRRGQGAPPRLPVSALRRGS